MLQQNTRPKKLREARVCLTYMSLALFIIEGNHVRNSKSAETWKQKLMQRAWKDAAYHLAPSDLLNLLFIESSTTSPGMASPTMSWVLPDQTLIKKLPYKLACSPILWHLFLNEDPFSQTTLSCIKLK